MPLPGASAEEGGPARAIEVDESELVRRAQLGSAAAFEKLVLARGPDLYRFLAARLANDVDAFDALQDSLTAAWQALPRLKSADRFWPWLCSIAAHKSTDLVRQRMASGEEAPQALDDNVASEVRETLAALPEHLREVLLLRYLLGLSEGEVAHALGIRLGTVKSRSSRARKAFREVWR